jgi:hypothetical protein
MIRPLADMQQIIHGVSSNSMDGRRWAFLLNLDGLLRGSGTTTFPEAAYNDELAAVR